MDKTRKYLIEATKAQLERYQFNMRVAQCAVDVLAPYQTKMVTKREATKILNELNKAYPEATLYFKNEKWGREAQYRLRSIDANTDVAIESLMSERIYTPEIHTKNVERLGYATEHYNNAVTRLDCITDLYDLHLKQELEREELQKRQELECQTFCSQTKCETADISYLLKEVEERLHEESRDEYYRKQNEEFEARRAAIK